ncbi:hypothetical protein OSB04_022111 [Centaurea solstitialis]|uniref:Uncharacterized protein n=1 Tax=Centaurea solstitialis TaxID=347529 RepID=A0AA38SVR0_9ASTR|nr:hypothetical protein OSB04_022111 [Centaurea solstitialis]
MAESGNPQFVMASNPLSNDSGIICVITLVTHLVIVLDIYFTAGHGYTEYQSDYEWSTLFIFITYCTYVAGNIAPIFRCFTRKDRKLIDRYVFSDRSKSMSGFQFAILDVGSTPRELVTCYMQNRTWQGWWIRLVSLTDITRVIRSRY